MSTPTSTPTEPGGDQPAGADQPAGDDQPAGAVGALGAVGDAPATTAHSESTMRELWGALSDPRRAACLSWLAFGVTWLITRFITIHGKDTGKGAAITIARHHVHHYLFGIILLGLISAIALFAKPNRGWEFLGIGYGIALALIMDEYALLLNLSDVYWKQQGQLSVDLVLIFLAAGGVYITAMAWVNESVRRGRRRARELRRRRRPRER